MTTTDHATTVANPTADTTTTSALQAVASGPRNGAQVSEKQARQVAEAARQQGWDRPSFAKGLYLGRFDLSLIHPHARAEASAAERGEAFLTVLAEYCAGLDSARIERDSVIPDEYLEGFRRLGTFGMKIPTEYGGLGLPMSYYARALVLIGSVHPSLGALLSGHQSIGVPEPVKRFGTPEQKQRFLPRCAGGAISAFLLTESDVGSDPARLGTAATLSKDGSEYVLEGVKLWTTNGVVAELLVVMAQVPAHAGGRGGITAFVVEADAPGITVERRNAFMGLRGIENGVTRLHQVRVPVQDRLGEEGQGLKIALTTLNTGRLSIPALCAAGSKWATKIAREWSAARVQWGKPVGEHEAIASKLSFMAATTFAMEAVLDLSAQLADAGETDIRIEAALAKLWSSEMAWKIADELMQIRGGRGYETAESLAARGERAVPTEQLMRDTRVNRIFEGSTEIMHLLIAREAVDAHLSAAGELASVDATVSAKARDAVKASGFYARWLPQLLAGKGNLPGSYAEFGPLAKHLRYVERTSRKMARHTFYGMGRWQANLEYRQVFLARVVDIGAELYAMAAACSRVEMLRADTGYGETAYALAETFCQQARVRIKTHLATLWDNSDAADRKLSKRLLDGELMWLEEGVVDPSEGTGPWITSWTAEESTVENQARRVR